MKRKNSYQWDTRCIESVTAKREHGFFDAFKKMISSVLSIPYKSVSIRSYSYKR